MAKHMKKISLLSEDRQMLIFSIITVWAFSIKLDIAELSDGLPYIFYFINSCGGGYLIVKAIAVPVLYSFYKYVHKEILQNASGREHLTYSALAVLMSMCMMLGYSYEKIADWGLVFNMHKLQWLKVLIVFAGYTFLFYAIIAWILSTYGKREIWFADREDKFGVWMSKHTYIKVFAIFALAYVPYIVLTYPGMIMWDTREQIIQAYSELKIFEPPYIKFRQLSDAVYLNGHHPVAHTLLIHACTELGRRLFGSYNIGYFCYSLIQAVFQIAVFSKIVTMLVGMKVKWRWIVFTATYYMFAPGINVYVLYGTKDTIYASFVILAIIELFNIIRHGNSRRSMIWLYLSCFGVMMFRNDGIYVLLVSMAAIMLAWRDMRKNLAILCISMLAIHVFYSIVILPAFSITSGSKREMLSIPFQQTARYVRDSSDGVTEDERKAIDAVLDFGIIGEIYNPENSDSVKGTYKELASREDIMSYFSAWVKMFFKHPSHYLQATINNYYYYFYFGNRKIDIHKYAWSVGDIDELNKEGEMLGFAFHFPERFDKWRERYELLRDGIASLPIISIVMSAATYAWGLLLLAAYALAHRLKKAVPLTAILLAVLLVCLASPWNGWKYRYLYPVAFCLPAVYFMVFYLRNNEYGN